MFSHLINATVAWFEQQAFGVCAWLGNVLGIRSTTIRLYFIYLSFFTFGSPIIIYFILAFIRENRKFFLPNKGKRTRTWDL
jgi:phage shock protein C